MNQDLMVFFQEMIYLKNKGWGLYNKLDEYLNVGTHWIALFCKKNEIIYFDSFGVEYIPNKTKEFIRNKNIKTNIFRVQEDNSIICGYFCIGFIDFMLAGTKRTDYTNLFSPHD